MNSLEKLYCIVKPLPPLIQHPIQPDNPVDLKPLFTIEYGALYFRLLRLLHDLSIAKADCRYDKLLAGLARMELYNIL